MLNFVVMNEKYIILYDGECNFCSFWVKYVIKRDKKDSFRFATLKSKKANELFQKHNIDNNIETIFLINENCFSTKSTAVLHILKELGGIKAIFYAFIIIPKFIRDFIYDVIAKNRYRWFGKTNCNFNFHEYEKDKFLV